jgi:hypothetical protein
MLLRMLYGNNFRDLSYFRLFFLHNRFHQVFSLLVVQHVRTGVFGRAACKYVADEKGDSRTTIIKSVSSFLTATRAPAPAGNEMSYDRDSPDNPACPCSRIPA